MRQQLEETYRSQRQGLFAMALTITRCAQLAEDAIHVAFERLCRHTNSPSGDLTSYVYVAVRNASRDAVRNRRARTELTESLFNGYSAPEQTGNPASDLLTEERDDQLRQAVDGLPDAEREVVVLKIFSGLTFDAVGRVLDQSPKTVATRYRRALQKLEEKLRGQL